MAWTSTELDELERAYKSGVLTIKYQDRVITYRSREDLARIILDAKRELGLVKKGPARVLASYSKGLKDNG